ncbi:MAG: aldolase/citrate lyase family protein [Clostridia bacterium]|nr:aldolase/citrate lyase family protein [Clostridia bacterium]
MALDLIYITNNPKVALIAEKNGVEYIMVDLETLGKEERQKNMNSVKSHHSIRDIEIISNVLTKSSVLVRVNPINPNSKSEIEKVIAAGADMIMLPMWKNTATVKKFLDIVNNRVKTMLLLETREATECVDEVLAMGNFDEIHIGLNDLHLSYGLTFMFEPLTNGTVEMLCNKFQRAGVPYGFGGIACINKGILPAEKIVMEHYRLGSTKAILSRSFCNTEEIKNIKEIESIFFKNIINLRNYESSLLQKTEDEYKKNTESVKKCVAQIVEKIKEKKSQ